MKFEFFKTKTVFDDLNDLIRIFDLKLIIADKKNIERYESDDHIMIIDYKKKILELKNKRILP